MTPVTVKIYPTLMGSYNDKDAVFHTANPVPNGYSGAFRDYAEFFTLIKFSQTTLKNTVGSGKVISARFMASVSGYNGNAINKDIFKVINFWDETTVLSWRPSVELPRLSSIYFPLSSGFRTFIVTSAVIEWLNGTSWTADSGLLIKDTGRTENLMYLRTQLDGTESGRSYLEVTYEPAISPPGAVTSPTAGTSLTPKIPVSISFGASTAPSISLYEVDYRYDSGNWAALDYNNTLTRSLTLSNNVSLSSVSFRVRAKDTNAVYSEYVYSGSYPIIHSVAPSFTVDTLPNYSLYKGDTIPINGTVLDPDVGDAVSVKYRIGNGTPRTIESRVSTGVTIPFNKTLTYRDGKIFDGVIEVTTTLSEGVPYKLFIWSEDDRGSKSAEHVTDFTVILNYPPVIDMISTAYPHISWDVTDADIGGSIKRTSLLVNGIGVFTLENPPKRNVYELTPGKLLLGTNELLITAEDDFGAVVSRKFKAVMSRVRIPETQLTLSLSSETTSDILLTMKRADVNEEISITQIIGGLD